MQLSLGLTLENTMSTRPTEHFNTVGEIQVTYRRRVKFKDLKKVTSSRDVYQILNSLWDHNTITFVEHFKVLFLNRANLVIGSYHLSSGGTCACIAEPKLIFAAAIKVNASGICLAHNHPSGNLKPSQADMDLTKKVKEAGKLLEIQLLDHIILTDSGYYSFADEGML